VNKLAVIAIGGNSLIRDEKKSTIQDQYESVCETTRHFIDIIKNGYDIIITHGNGPQVGFVLRRAELAYKTDGLHLLPLVTCGAGTQGAIGYQIQQALGNEFSRRGINKKTVTVITQCLVDKNDKAFQNPTKPIGSFYKKDEYEKLMSENPDWIMVEDSGRGYRRVVPSPKPQDIIEKEVIKELVRSGHCVIATGGGGLPVIRNKEGILEGIDAVIDKDFASSLLAKEVKADLLIISTGVPNVCLNYGTPEQKDLKHVRIEELKKYVSEGHFAPGSMKPKILAIIEFIESGGERAIITNHESLSLAIEGKAGTHIEK
jgi:carbamate kinase